MEGAKASRRAAVVSGSVSQRKSVLKKARLSFMYGRKASTIRLVLCKRTNKMWVQRPATVAEAASSFGNRHGVF